MKLLILTTLFFLSTAHAQLDNILSPARLPYLKNSKLVQVSSFDSSGGNNDFIAIAPGETQTIASLQGPGMIVKFWVTIATKEKYFLRTILLRMYWDDEKYPSVEVPIGDFFGTGFQYKHYVTPYIGMSSGGYYCYFPMPFNTSARVEVVNQSSIEVNSFYYHIDYQKLYRPLDSTVAYFHAQWHRETRCDPAKNYTILDAEGTGHFVGLNMSMQSYEKGMQYLEGDEMVYVDGEKFPSLYGTGTEDYFTGGWYFNHGEFAAPYHGLILKDDSLSRIAAYRFHILDAIPFTKSIRFEMEHGTENVERADYSSTAYWYQLEPHKPFPEMLPAGMRIPLRVAVPNKAIEAESFTPVNSITRFSIEDMSLFGADWSGNRQLKITAKAAGEKMTLDLPAIEESYDIAIYYTIGPDYGNVDVLYAGKKIGTITAFNKTIMPGGKILFKSLKTQNKMLPLQFVIKGKDPSSSGYSLGLDAFVLTPNRKFISEWYMIGPFANPRNANLVRLGIDIPYPPEQEIDLKKTYPGVDNKPIGWTLDKTPTHGRMDLYKYDPYELVVVYALTYVYSPKEQTLPLLLGSDDGVKVFLNDKEIHRFLAVRIAEPDQDRVSLVLKQGWNKLLLKIENNFGGYNFYARILDPDKIVVVNAQQKLTKSTQVKKVR
ncbi:MAG: glycoside hydrolase family 172 protein [Chloroflexota bacterium]